MRWSLASLLVVGCGRVHFDGVPGPSDAAERDGAGSADAAFIGNRAFVTSTAQAPGSLGGLAGADALCNARATSAGLPGTYVAWLSTMSGVKAIDRLAGSSGWLRVDNQPFVNAPADLALGSIFYPLEVDELGQRAAEGTLVATATTPSGAITGSDCSAYTSTSNNIWLGRTSYARFEWTESVQGNCGSDARLYCFGLGANIAVAPFPQPSRRAFVVVGAWQPSQGIVAADAACQAAANAGAIAGTFQALIARTGASAIGRFSLTGAPWARLDGVLLAATPSDFAAGDWLAALDVGPTGQYDPGSSVWIGASGPSAVATVASNCNGWTTSASTQSAVIGQDISARTGAAGGATSPCSSTGNALYCLEP